MTVGILNKNCCPECNPDPCECPEVPVVRTYDCNCPSPYRTVFNVPDNPTEQLPNSDVLPCCPVNIDSVSIDTWVEQTNSRMIKVEAAAMASQYGLNAVPEYRQNQTFVHWTTSEWHNFAPEIVTNQYTGESKVLTRTSEPCAINCTPYMCTQREIIMDDNINIFTGGEVQEQRFAKMDTSQYHDPEYVNPYTGEKNGEYSGWTSPCIDYASNKTGYQIRYEKRFIDGEVGEWENGDQNMTVQKQIGGNQLIADGQGGYSERSSICECGSAYISAGLVFFGYAFSRFSGNFFYGIRGVSL
jgi:hypothetical protein